MELYIVPFCGFSPETEIPGKGAVQLSAEANNAAAMDLKQDYIITIQNTESSASIPTTKEAADPASAASNNDEEDKGGSSDPNPASNDTGAPAPARKQTASTGPLAHTGDVSPAGVAIALAFAAVAVVCAAAFARERCR